MIIAEIDRDYSDKPSYFLCKKVASIQEAEDWLNANVSDTGNYDLLDGEDFSVIAKYQCRWNGKDFTISRAK